MSFCVLRWQDGADLTNIPQIKGAWLNQFCNMQIEMQTGIKVLHFQAQALHDCSDSPEIIELLVQQTTD